MKPRFKIGQTYIKRGVRKDVCTITDIHTTFNNANEIVKIRYEATHDFLGQSICESEIIDTTIARGRMDEKGMVML